MLELCTPALLTLETGALLWLLELMEGVLEAGAGALDNDEVAPPADELDGT